MRRLTRINLNSNHQLPIQPPEPTSVSPDTAPSVDPEVHLETNFNRMEARFQQAHSLAEGTTSRGGRAVVGAVAHHEPPRRSNDAKTELTPSFVQGSSGRAPRTTQPDLPPLDIPDPSIPRRLSAPQPTVNGHAISRSGSSSSTPMVDTRQPVHATQPHSQPQQLRTPGLYLQHTHPRAQSSPVLHNQSHPSTPQAHFSSPVSQYPSPSQQYASMPHMSPRAQAQMPPPLQPSPAQPNVLALISERLDFIVDSLEANRAQQKTMSHRLLAYERNFGAIDMKLEKQQEDMNNVIAFLKNILVEQEALNAQRLTALEKTLATTVETVNNSLEAFVNSIKSSKQDDAEKVPGRKADQEDKTFQFLTVLTQRVGDIGHSLSGVRYALGIDDGNRAAQKKGKQRAFETMPTSSLPERLLSASGPSAGIVIDVDALDDDVDAQSRSPTAVDRSGLRGWMPGSSSSKRSAGTDSEGRSIMERLEANESLLMDIAELLENMRDPQANLSSNMDLAADQETPAPSANEANVNKDGRSFAQSITLRQLASRLSSSISAQTLSQDRSGTPIPTASESSGHTSKIDQASILSSQKKNAYTQSFDAASEGGSQVPVGVDTSMIVDSADNENENSEVRIRASGHLGVKLLKMYSALVHPGATGGISQSGSGNFKSAQIQVELPVPTSSSAPEGVDAQVTADDEFSLANRTKHSAVLKPKLSPYPSSSMQHLDTGSSATQCGQDGEGMGDQLNEDSMAVDDVTAITFKLVSETYKTTTNGSTADSEPYIIGMTTLEDMMAGSQRISPPITSKNSGPSRIPVVAGAKVPKEPKDKTKASPRTRGTIQADISSSRSVAKTRSMSFLNPSDSTKSPNKVSTPVKSSSLFVNVDLSPVAWAHSSALPFDLAELPEYGTPTSSKRSLRSASQKGPATPSASTSNDNVRVTRSKVVSPNATMSNTAAVKTPVLSKVKEIETAERAITGLLTAQKRTPPKIFTLASVVPRIREADPTAPETVGVTTAQGASTNTQETRDISLDQNTTSGTLSSIDTTVTCQDTTVDQSDLPSLPSHLAIPDDASGSYVLNKSYRLPSQPEGSVASLRQEALGNPFIHAGVGVRSPSVEPGGGASGSKQADDNMDCNVSIEVEPVDEDCIEDKSQSGEMMITTPAVAFREPSYMSALTPLPETEALASLNASRAASIDHLEPETFSSVLPDQSMDQEPKLLEEGHNEPDNVAPENLICYDTPLKEPSRGTSPEEEQMTSPSPVTRTLEVDNQDELPAAPPVSSQRSGTTVDEDTVQDLVLESHPETSPLRNSEVANDRKGSTSALSTPQQNHASMGPSYSPENIHAAVSVEDDGSKETRNVHGLPAPDSEGMRQSPTAQADIEEVLSLEANATSQPGSPHVDRDGLDSENLMHVKRELDNSVITHTAASAQEPATPLRSQIGQSPERAAQQTYIYISDELETPKKVPSKKVPFKKITTQRKSKKKRSPSVISISDDDLDTLTKKRKPVRQVDESIISISDDDEKGLSGKKRTDVGPMDENASVPAAKMAFGSAAGSNHDGDVEVGSTTIASFGNPAGTSTPLRGRSPVDSGSAVDGQLAGNEISTSAIAEDDEGGNNLLTRALSPVSDLSRSPSPAPEVLVQTPPQRARTPALPEPSSAVKKYIARLDAEDEIPIIPPKRRKVSEATESTRANDVAGPSNHLTQKAAAPKKPLLVLQKKGKSAAVTKVKKRKAPIDGLDENDDQPPLKKANIRKDSFKGIEEKKKTEAEHKKDKETIKVKDKGKLQERLDRTPIKQAKIEQVHTSLRGQPSRSVNVKWPTIDKPNFDQFIQCNTCNDWYHIGCVGVASNDPRLDDSEDYSCPPCNAGVTSQASESPVKGEQSSYPKGSACSRPKCHRRQKTKKKKSEPEPQTFVVEAFIGRYRKVIGGKGITTFYLVKWHGYPLSECTWEELNAMGLANSAVLIDTFEKAATEEDIDLKAFEDECQLLQEAIDAGWSTSPPSTSQ